MCNVSVQQANGTTVTQSFPAGNIYVAYAMFVGGQVNVRSKINFTKSSDCGATWTKPIIISQTYATPQGAAVAVDPETRRLARLPGREQPGCNRGGEVHRRRQHFQ